MSLENSIEVTNLVKKFKIYYDKGHMLKERLIFANRNKYEEREVLKGISFNVKKGEAIGLIGKNGCGKSTTLKLLNRIIYPDSGTVKINGKVSSLIELGAGFHEDMTGRENIYINASIFGLTRKEIDERLDDIIRFSELEEFIDNPVRTYSSGMYMRLAFSVAINVDADILLIDEILAVGDVNFQEKCFRKLLDVKHQETTIVIVSHSLGQIERICDRAILIEDGLITEDGNPKTVCKHYLETMEYARLERAEQEYIMLKEEEEKEKKQREEEKKLEDQKKKEDQIREKQENERKLKNLSCKDICEQCDPNARRTGSGPAFFTDVGLYDEKGNKCNTFECCSPLTIKMSYSSAESHTSNVSVCITRQDWTFCAGFTPKMDSGKEYLFEGNGNYELIIPKMTLLPGTYMIDFFITKNGENEDALYEIIHFKIVGDNYHNNGLNVIEHVWKKDSEIIEVK